MRPAKRDASKPAREPRAKLPFQTVTVGTNPRYQVYVGPSVFEPLREFCAHYPRLFVLTDENVARLQLARLGDLPRATIHTVKPGEDSKSFAVLENVLDAMTAAGCDRSSGLVAFGGGVVGDLGGLAAALFMRGIDCVQAPTTLLAMVDSSVGGKTAVNLRGGKNLAGAFHQPRQVFADTTALVTLPEDEYCSGLGEVLKTAIIDGDLFTHLEKRAEALVTRDPKVLGEVVRACVLRKAAIVAHDPFEKGQRKLLNLGHTFAHAIEHASGFGRVPHGIAVAVGVVLAARTSHELERAPRTLVEQISVLARKLGLPVTLGDLRARYGVDPSDDALLAAMKHDKKSASGDPRFVLPVELGLVAYDVSVPEALVRTVLSASRAASA